MPDDFVNPFDAEPATSAAPATPQTDSFVNPFDEPKSSVPSAVAPKPDAPKKKSLGDRAYSFLEEGGLGAALGAITPELTTGAGMALSAFPLTAPIGVTLTGVGSAMKGTRALQAGLGLASGLSGEAAAQTAELFKQPEKVQEIARLAAGAVTPELGSLVKFAAKKLISEIGLVTTGTLNQAVKSIATDLGMNEKQLSPTQRQYIEKVLQDIRGGGKSDTALEGLYANLDAEAKTVVQKYKNTSDLLEYHARNLAERAASGEVAGERVYLTSDQLSRGAEELVQRAQESANAILKGAETRAAKLKTDRQAEGGQAMQMAEVDSQDIMQNGLRQAQALVQEAQQKAARYRQVAESARTSGGQRVAKAGESLAEVGTARLPTETGNDIRAQVMPVYENLVKVRSDNAAANKSVAFNAAADKEAQGVFAKDTTAFNETLDMLKSDIKTATLDAVSSPLKRIKEALDRNFVNEAGDLVKRPPVTFEGLELIRRFLRDRSYGLPAEGFDAINQQMAGKLANQIEKIQVEFSPSIETFLKQYATDSQPLTQFKTRLGKAVGEVEDFDMGRLVTDPADIGSKFFRTQRGVEDLTSLLGSDPVAAEKIARGYTMDNLRGADAKAIQSFTAKNRDWLVKFPELNAQLESAAGKIGGAETISAKRSTLSDALRGNASTALFNAPTRAEDIASKAVGESADIERKGAETQAGLLAKGEQESSAALVKGGESAANILQTAAGKISQQGDEFLKLVLGKEAGSQAELPAQRIKQIILSGNPDLWSEVAPIIANNPEAKANFVASLKQVIADEGMKSPRSLIDTFNRKIKPIVEQFELMSPKQVKELQQKMSTIDRTIEGKQQAGIIQRLITNALVTEGASGLTSVLQPRNAVQGIMGMFQ